MKGAKLHTNVKCKSESVANKITLIILHAAVLKCLIELNSLLHGGLQKKNLFMKFLDLNFKIWNLFQSLIKTVPIVLHFFKENNLTINQMAILCFEKKCS